MAAGAGLRREGDGLHGAFCRSGIDTGPIIVQQTVPVLDADTPESLHERIQQAERVAYPAAIAALARGAVRVQGRRTTLEPGR